MPRVPKADGPQTPSAHDLVQDTCLIEKPLSRSKGQLIDGIRGEIVADVKYAGAFVAPGAIQIFRAIGLPSSHRSVIDRMRPGIAGLEQQTVGETSLERKCQRVITAVAAVGLEIDGTEGVSDRWIVHIKSACDIAVDVRRGDTQIHGATRKEPYAMGSKIGSRDEEIRRKFVIDGQAPGLGVKIAAPVPLQGARLVRGIRESGCVRNRLLKSWT